ncbi:MAG: extracellular solute-binding protein [Clostridiales bacterium]|nr:extracellular solute-binding protein [Clostridiales bacterium]
MKKMKKLFCMIMCLLLVLSMFTACKKDKSNVADTPNADKTGTNDKEEQDSPQDEEIELTLGIWPEETLVAEIELHNGYVEKFNESHPNVTVVPAYYKYAVDTFVPKAEAGTLPVIFETWYTDTQKLINGGFVADITEELSARGWLDEINPSIKELMSKDGKTYGIPRDGYALGLMLNVELFEEAGLVDSEGLPIYPKTWDELAKTGKIIKDKTGAAGLCLLAMDNAGGWHFSNIAWNFGATLTTIDADGNYHGNLDTPEAIAAMEYVKSLKWEYDILTADPTVENWGTGFTQLGTGGAAMYIAANDAVNQPTYNNGLAVDKLSIVPVPAGPNGHQYSLSGGTPYMFSKSATPEQINAALDYLVLMGKGPELNEEGIIANNQYCIENGIPVIPRFPAWASEELKEAEDKLVKEYSNVDMRLYDDYFEILKKAGNLRQEEPGATQEMYAQLTNVLQEVIVNKDADVAALMKTANDNYQTILDTTINNQ